MNTHKNARLTPYSREELVRCVLQEGTTVRDAAAAFGVFKTTARKWITRFRAEGADGLENRSSRPHRLHSSIPEHILCRIAALRLQRWTGKRIAAERGISASTVSHHLRLLKLSKMKDIEPRPAIIRYERETSGEIMHIDIKALRCFTKPGHRVTGRHTGTVHTPGAGWEYLHVAIDDHSRISFVSMMPDQTSRSAIAFLQVAIGYYQSLGVTVKGIMTDNGPCYTSKFFRKACARLDIRHRRTRPYTPRTNGKAERFIQTALREWAYAAVYQTSLERHDRLPVWIHRYHWHRPHSSLKGKAPISRLGLSGNNLADLHR